MLRWCNEQNENWKSPITVHPVALLSWNYCPGLIPTHSLASFYFSEMVFSCLHFFTYVPLYFFFNCCVFILSQAEELQLQQWLIAAMISFGSRTVLFSLSERLSMLSCWYWCMNSWCYSALRYWVSIMNMLHEHKSTGRVVFVLHKVITVTLLKYVRHLLKVRSVKRAKDH